MKVSLNTTYGTALAVIERAVDVIMSQAKTDYTVDVYSFENDMNSLSGAILNLDPSLQQQIKNAVEVVVWGFNSKGFEVNLTESLLNTNVSHETSFTQQGKKLYPLTTSVVITANLTPSNTGTVSNADSSGASANGYEGSSSSTIIYDANTLFSLTDDLPEVVDPIFDDMDAEAVTEEPLATLGNEYTPIISNSMIALAKTAAGNVGGLQDGLTTFSYNPLADLINSARNLFIYYTENNYANLNIALGFIAFEMPFDELSYKNLCEVIGGSDGLSGCVAQLDFFLEHTNRLSGLILDTDSPNDVIDNDSSDEYININDVSNTEPVVIFSFDGRYFRSAKYTIQATAASLTRAHQMTEIAVLHDNYNTFIREIMSVYTEDPFVSYTSRLVNNRIEVLANTNYANTDFVAYGNRLRIARAAQTYGNMSQSKIIGNHETLQTYLNDGVDYVAQQSGSLLRGDLVANLSQFFTDILVNLASDEFENSSSGYQIDTLTNVINEMKLLRQAIQTQIDTDWNNFESCRRLVESLDIAYNLTTAYTDSTGNAIPQVTLNSGTIAAINETQ